MAQRPVLSKTLGKKLYSKRAVMIGTLVGGPLAGGYMLAKNFKTIEKPEKTSQAWTVAVAAIFGIILLAVIIPRQVPDFLFIFLYAWMGYFAAHKMQGRFLDSHEENGGKFHNNWKAAGIGLIVALISLALYLLVLTIAGPGSQR
jgi:hypothetical protein